jgi:hypothetical protein
MSFFGGLFGSKPAPAPAPAPAAAGGGGRAKVDYASLLRDANKAKEDHGLKLKQCELKMAGYLEKAQAAATRGDTAGSLLAAA